MDNKVDLQLAQIQVEPARGRQTADNSFGAMVGRGAASAVRVVGAGVRTVADFVPGGGLVSAVADVVGSAASGSGGIGGVGGDKWNFLQAQSRLQEEGLSNSMRLLALQKKMSEESQAYTAMSNVMKVRHEMAKAAIGNIR